MSRSKRAYSTAYRAANATEAHLIRGILGQHGIEARLVGEGLSSAMGELPATVAEVEIQVPTGYLERARELCRDYENSSTQKSVNPDPWFCSECREENPSTFGVCWNCQAPQNP